MWSDEKQRQFDRLRQREAQGSLSEAEAEALRALVAELDAEEAAALRPAIEQMRVKQEELARERRQVEVENERLAAILAKQERLLSEARQYLDHLRTERAALCEEYRAVTGRQLLASP